MQWIKRSVYICLSLSFLAMSPCIFLAKDITIEEFIADKQDVGVYPVIIQADSEKTTKKIFITVLYPNTVMSDVNQEIIDAKDVRIPIGTFNKTTDNELLIMAQARAWNTKNGEQISVHVVDRTELQKGSGVFTVTFQTKKGTSVVSQFIELPEELLLNDFQLEEYYIDVDAYKYVGPTFINIALFIVIPTSILFFFYVFTANRVYQIRKLLKIE